MLGNKELTVDRAVVSGTDSQKGRKKATLLTSECRTGRDSSQVSVVYLLHPQFCRDCGLVCHRLPSCPLPLRMVSTDKDAQNQMQEGPCVHSRQQQLPSPEAFLVAVFTGSIQHRETKVGDEDTQTLMINHEDHPEKTNSLVLL